MIVTMFAEVLELIKVATTQGLAKKQEQPIDMSLFNSYYRTHETLPTARMAIRKCWWKEPLWWSPIEHRVSVGDYVVGYFIIFLKDVVHNWSHRIAPTKKNTVIYIDIEKMTTRIYFISEDKN